MKKFVSLCAFVAALSFASCTGSQTEGNETTDSTATADSVVTPVVEEVVAAVDSTAVQAEEVVESVVAE